jgi:hypothetical protein
MRMTRMTDPPRHRPLGGFAVRYGNRMRISPLTLRQFARA